MSPAALGLALGVLSLGHLFTGLRHTKFTELAELATGDPARRICFAFLLAFSSWTLMSLAWSPDPMEALEDLAPFVLTAPVAGVLAIELSQTRPRTMPFAIPLGIIAASVLLIMEMKGVTSLHRAVVAENQLFDLNRMALWVALLLACWPVLLAMLRVPIILTISALVLGVAALMQTDAQAAQLALAAGLLAAGIARLLPRLVPWVFGAVAAAIVAMPFLIGGMGAMTDAMPKSFVEQAHTGHRVALWEGYAALVPQRFLLGHGAYANRELGMSGKAGSVAAARGYPAFTTNPHNGALEVWIDYGAVGAALIAGLFVSLGLLVSRLPQPPRTAATFLFATACCYALTGSSIMQGWWLANLAVALGALIALERMRRARGHS
ncbi:O-antigen ligase family protein [Rhizobiaceae bacterium]|nr:O-antigen ligase family protein [Rhizobiaceae bacterium]